MIIWGGKFGRLPLSQVDPRRKNRGRDHGSGGFNTWLVGAGVKGGTVYGATDDVGYKAVENPVSVSDFHAKILHLLGYELSQLDLPAAWFTGAPYRSISCPSNFRNPDLARMNSL